MYSCPRCDSAYCEVPIECNNCGKTGDRAADNDDAGCRTDPRVGAASGAVVPSLVSAGNVHRVEGRVEHEVCLDHCLAEEQFLISHISRCSACNKVIDKEEIVSFIVDWGEGDLLNCDGEGHNICRDFRAAYEYNIHIDTGI